MKKVIFIFLMLAAICYAEPERVTYDTVSNPVQLRRFLDNPLFPGDVTFDGVYDAMWDQSANTFLFKDNALAGFGTSSDATIGFDATNFEILALAADTPFAIGAVATGFDITYYFETAGTITTDYDGDKMAFSDDMVLEFGTGSDATIVYDETTDDALEITVASATVSVVSDDMTVTTDAAAANQFKVDATGTVAGFAVVVETTDGGVQVNADGAANGDVTIDAQDDVTLTADGVITTDGAFYATSVVSETHSANDTLDNAADVGTLMLVDTDAVVLTLPAVGTGLKYKIMNIGADGTVEISVDVNASDKILGGCGFTALDDGDKITNTKATADIGDYVVLEYGTADGWFITEMVGTWADGGA
jgi:hypothetical protein